LTLLTSEIAVSSIASALDGINLEGPTYTFVFLGTLTSAEQTTLDGIVAAHTGEATPAEQFAETAHTVPPSVLDGASQGYVLGSRWFVGSDLYVCTDTTSRAAVWVRTTVPRFEPERFYSEVPKPNTHTSTSMLAANTLNATVEGGTYSLDWYYEWALNYYYYAFKAEVLVDGVVVARHVQNPWDLGGGISVSGSRSGTNKIHPVQGFWEGMLSPGAHTIKLLFATGSSYYQATVYQSRLRLTRVG